MLEFIKATNQKHFLYIEKMAYTIWQEHYVPIIGKPQVDYMLKKFQSVKAIKNQIADGYEYFLLEYRQQYVGYISVKQEKNTLFLSKIYVLRKYRGKKIGKKALGFIEEKAKQNQLKNIRLTVNKNNSQSINAYQKLGFKNRGPITMDIGQGYVMDDFEMVKSI